VRTATGRTALVVAGTLLAWIGFTAPAGATHVGCGQVITSSTTLDSDVGPCPNNGIIVQGNDVKLDLNGYEVFGTDEVGDGAGILVRDSRGGQGHGRDCA
jgi:hypothetical protein